VIVITHIVAPQAGWPVALHCPICGRTSILLELCAEKPRDADYCVWEGICPDDVGHMKAAPAEVCH